MSGASFLNLILKLTDKNSADASYRDLALNWFNLVINDISNRQTSFHWRFLEKTATASTVISQFEYQLPSDIDTSKAIHVYDKTNDRTYTFVPYEKFRQFIADETNDTGDINIFSIWAEQLLLWPLPSSEITIYIDYIQTITALADDSNSIEIPAKYDQIMIDGVLLWAYGFDQELGNQNNQRLIYESGIDRMVRDNGQIIAENQRPISHRTKHIINREVSGKNSILFPLAGTNI